MPEGTGALGSQHFGFAYHLPGQQVVKGHERAKITQLERHQAHNPEMQRVDANLDSRLGNGSRYQDNGTERVHHHADHGQHQYDHHHRHPGAGQAFGEQGVHDVGTLQNTTQADRETDQGQQGANMHGRITGSRAAAIEERLGSGLAGFLACLAGIQHHDSQHYQRQNQWRTVFFELKPEHNPDDQDYAGGWQ